MRHQRAKRTLGLTVDHRKALLANMVCSLVQHKKIRTTHLKAKEAGRFTEKMITIAKKQTLAARRQLIAELRSREAASVLIGEVAKAFKNRQGGYTRVLKGSLRSGDGAQMAYLEFTEDYQLPGRKAPKKKAKKEEKPEAEKAKGEKPTKAKKEEEAKKVEAEEGKEDEKKSSGFLGNLRGFLKGD